MKQEPSESLNRENPYTAPVAPLRIRRNRGLCLEEIWKQLRISFAILVATGTFGGLIGASIALIELSQHPDYQAGRHVSEDEISVGGYFILLGALATIPGAIAAVCRLVWVMSRASRDRTD